jgi:hypothetical protein
MSSLTRILGLIAAGALVAVTAANFPARSGESGQGPAAVGAHAPSLTECRLLKRAISRRACQARLWREAPVETAENK